MFNLFKKKNQIKTTNNDSLILGEGKKDDIADLDMIFDEDDED